MRRWEFHAADRQRYFGIGLVLLCIFLLLGRIGLAQSNVHGLLALPYSQEQPATQAECFALPSDEYFATEILPAKANLLESYGGLAALSAGPAPDGLQLSVTPNVPELIIMNVGDSFSRNDTHRRELQLDLEDAGIPYDFVGDFSVPGTPEDIDHQAYGGMTFDAMLHGHYINRGAGLEFESGIVDALSRYAPNTFLVYGGANDLVFDSPDLRQSKSDWGALIDYIFSNVAGSPLVVVSNQLDYSEEGRWAHKRDNVLTFNRFLEEEIPRRQKLGQNIHLVDNFSAVDPTVGLSTSDGLHPNVIGSRIVGEHWYPAIRRGTIVPDCNLDGRVDILDANCMSHGTLDIFLAQHNTLRGDLDGQGGVDFADFLAFASKFEKTQAAYTDGDLDKDGVVAFSDFLILSDNFGQGSDFTTPGVAVFSVPEPVAVTPVVVYLWLSHRSIASESRYRTQRHRGLL